MKTKAKGFTVLEVIITLAITTMIIGTVYTFFFTSSKSLKNTDINSTLQSEGQAIENELILYGTQAEKLVSIDSTNSENITYNELAPSNGIKDVNSSIVFLVHGVNYLFEINGQTLTLQKEGEQQKKELTRNIKSFKVRPIDIKIDPKDNLDKAIGLEFVIVLHKKEGYSDVTVPVSTIVKFRNK